MWGEKSAVKIFKKTKKMAEMSLDSRMNRLVGQLEGIRRMIKSDRKTDDVIQQIMAAGQALSRIGILLLKEELMRTLASGTRREVGVVTRAQARVAGGGSAGEAKGSEASGKAKTLGGISMKQADLDSKTARDTEKLLEKIFRM